MSGLNRFLNKLQMEVARSDILFKRKELKETMPLVEVRVFGGRKNETYI